MEAKTAEEKATFNRLSTIKKIVGNIIFGTMVLIIAALAFFLVQSKLTGGPPVVAGHYMFIVLSGSMNPAFDTGSLIFVKPKKPEEIAVGDIITFKGLGANQSLTSHRVVEINNDAGNISFITRGDANEANDPTPVPVGNLVGKVSFAIPYMGYLLDFMQTKQGLIYLVIIPGALVILLELRSLYNKASKTKKKQENSQA